MPDYIQNTPRNGLLGYLADALGSVDQYAQRPDNTMPMGKANPVLSILSNALVAPMQRTFDRVSYGEPVTNYGKANVPLIPQDTADTVANLLGLTAVAPKAVNALKPVAQTAYRNALVPSNVAHQGERGAIVWHGSPHKFDKFDASKIGTGEGAQAYGHGLYLAESPETARFYQDSLTDRFPAKLDGKPMGELSTAQRSALGILNEYGGNVDSALAFAKREMQKAGSAGADFHVDRYNTLFDIKKGRAAAETASPSLYKVDLPDEAIAKMLDWDKPLSQQALEVRVALTNIAKQDPEVMKVFRELGPTAPANQAYAALTQHAVRMKKYEGMRAGMDEAAAMPSLAYGQDAASSLMRQQGIPGIRYLDGGSRGTGQGTSNFVVFPGNEGLLQILERNGQPVR